MTEIAFVHGTTTETLGMNFKHFDKWKQREKKNGNKNNGMLPGIE